MATYVVNYTYAENSDVERDAHRPAHKDFLADRKSVV